MFPSQCPETFFSSTHAAAGGQWHKDWACASTSHSACCIGGKVIMMFRSVEEWWPDMPSFMDHNLLWVTQYLSHLFLLHLLVFHFIPLTV